MKQSLKENGGLPASILWTLAIVAGVSVANIYYIQPLLNMIRHELGISEFRTNLIAMVTQIGYAAGLLFITPLGDLYQRKKIILVNFFVLIFSLLTIALADNIHAMRQDQRNGYTRWYCMFRTAPVLDLPPDSVRWDSFQ